MADRGHWWVNADERLREAADDASTSALAYCEQHGHQWRVTSGPD